MLPAGHAPVGYRGAGVGCNCVERHVVNSIGAPARAGRLQPALGFRCALRCCSLRAPVPLLALRARRESLPGASLRARSQEKRAAEAPQAGSPITVWVKRMDVAGAQFVEVENVDLEQTVSKFKARWVAQAKLDVDPSLVTLRLVECGARKPTPTQEVEAEVLDDPRLTLADAGITDSCSLLAFVAGTSATIESTPQAAPFSAEAFWKQLPRATVEGNVLRLAGGTTFLGSNTLPGFMYIRNDYVGLWAEIQRLISSGLSRIVISGNPGIGKSWFGLYVAFMLLSGSELVTIVWESRRRSSRTLILNGQVFRGNLEAFVSELADTHTWYLVDEAVPPGATEVEARTLVFSSPKRENYKDTLKAPASTIRYMPVWSWEEIEACHSLLYADDSERPLSEVRNAFDKWGGIPRFVLEKLRDEAAQQSLLEALGTADMVVILKSVGQIDAATEASHRLLHIITSAPYVVKSIEFGSDYIKGRATEILLRRQRAELSYFVSRETDPLFAKLRGDCFEVLAHEKLSAGGEFPTRLLTGAAGSNIRSLPCASLRRFSGNKPEDLALLFSLPAGTYCRPLIGSFPVIDALILPGMLLQMTVSERHGVDEAKLGQILVALGLDSAELVFVVPPDKFDEFAAYKFKDAALGMRITQLALCVSFDVVIN